MAIARERCGLPPLRCMLRGWRGAPAVLGLRLRLPQAQAAPQAAWRWRRLGGGGVCGIQPLAAMDALPAAFAAYGSSIEPAGVGAVSLRRQSVSLDHMRGSTSPSSTNGCNVS
jgi:hypothetical protein